MQRLLSVALAVFVGACARPVPTCTDGLRNGLEADVDCGGPNCSPCAVGRACELPEDCASQVCRQHACAEASGAKCARNTDCPDGACLDGSCAPLCPTPLRACSGTCVDPKFDPKHCGACGQACLAHERCEAGACEVRCPPGTLACGSAPGLLCVDAQRDVLHCGNCTTVCAPGQTCTLGKCVSGCAPFQASCFGQCVSTLTDPLHCGGCGLPCDVGELCANGVCGTACTPPVVGCDGGVCVDVRFDPLNCGACGNACPPAPNAQRLCLDSVCTRTACNPGFDDCNGLPFDGCEAELAVDPLHCGACGRGCFSGPCQNGNCP